MDKIIRRQTALADRNRGVALLMVLLIVLAITIISAGFIARADVELACGENMLVRVQEDQTANSGLEYAKGLLRRPQSDSITPRHATDWYWLGGERIRLWENGGEYCDISVARDATDNQTYHVVSDAYREIGGQRVGGSCLAGDVRLDPCIGMWTKTNTLFRQNWVVQGDVCTQGVLVNQAPAASLDGDVFATQLTGASLGQVYAVADLPLTWPPVQSTYMNPPYFAYIHKHSGDYVLPANTTISGMLLVTGNLTVAGGGCTINCIRNLPALYVGGDLLLRDANNLTVTGLSVVDGNVLIPSGARGVTFTGGLCVAGEILETTPDASGNGNQGFLMNGPRWATSGSRNVLQFDGVDDYVQVPHNPSLCVATEVTVMAWINTSRYAYPGQSYQGILGKSNDPRSYSFYTMATGKLHLSTGPYPYDASTSTGTIPLNEWVHVCAMVRGGFHQYFINGAPAGSGTKSVTLPGLADTAPVVLGRGSEDLRQFAGMMDEVCIYNRALSDAEVANAANHVYAPAGLVGRWKLDGPGSSVTIKADPIKAAITTWDGAQWSPAAGAFLRNIVRR